MFLQKFGLFYLPMNVMYFCKRKILLEYRTIFPITMKQTFLTLVLIFGSYFSYTIQCQTDTVNVDEVVVTATRSPIFYKETARIITIITADQIRNLPVQSINELLETALGVDVRQRGVHGVQADISIRAGNFEQTLILLNGFKISDPQTGHHSMNLPVDIHQIERIEILQGPGARIFGANAFGGVVNIITRQPEKNTVEGFFSAGQYGLIHTGVQLAAKTGNINSQLAYNHKSSYGYMENTDFNSHNLYFQSSYSKQLLSINLYGGYTQKEFGAQAFYTPKFPNQFEAIRVNFISNTISYGKKTQVTLKTSFRRHHDRFELFRDSAPAWYKGHNYHMSDVFSAEVNLFYTWRNFISSMGAEFRNEFILSNVLGKTLDNPRNVPGEPEGQFTKSASRNIGNIFLEQTYRTTRYFISGGALFNYYSDFSNKTFLGIDAAAEILKDLKLYTSANQSLRLPSYTELYYQGPTNISNPDLKPEESFTLEGGFKYQPGLITASAGIFYRWGKNLIDWVKTDSSQIKWQTINHTTINSIGLEFYTQADLGKLLSLSRKAKLSISYTFNEAQKEQNNYLSYYVMDYLKHNLSFSVSGEIYNHVSLTMQGNYQHRAGTYTAWDFETNQPIAEQSYKPYTTLDIRAYYQTKQIELFAQVNNLTNVKVIDFGNIPQPGRWALAGIKIKI